MKQTFMENVRLKKGGTLSLYWAKNQGIHKAIILRRCAGKVLAVFISSWKEAIEQYHKRILREGKRSKDQRNIHLLSLRIQPVEEGFRCLAICKTGRKSVDVTHQEHIGAMAKAFHEINEECGARHRKEYDMSEHHSYLR